VSASIIGAIGSPLNWIPPYRVGDLFSGIGSEQIDPSSKIGLAHPPYFASNPFLLNTSLIRGLYSGAHSQYLARFVAGEVAETRQR
jgi:hypothetical protein